MQRQRETLGAVALRLAGARERLRREGDFEIVALTGTLAPAGVHLHLAVADSTGQTLGGHLIEGCVVRTTAELVVAADGSVVFDREPDPATGFDELVIRPTAPTGE
jgi:predicted DNA-binding protein with PD1-like motif